MVYCTNQTGSFCCLSILPPPMLLLLFAIAVAVSFDTFWYYSTLWNLQKNMTKPRKWLIKEKTTQDMNKFIPTAFIKQILHTMLYTYLNVFLYCERCLNCRVNVLANSLRSKQYLPSGAVYKNYYNTGLSFMRKALNIADFCLKKHIRWWESWLVPR